MTYTSVETIALIIIAISAVKILVLLVNPNVWMKFSKWIYSGKRFTTLIFTILAAIVLYYLIQSGLTIVQILAVTAFVFLLIGIGLAKEFDHLVARYNVLIKKGTLWKEYWFYMLLWLVLLGWGVKELFF